MNRRHAISLLATPLLPLAAVGTAVAETTAWKFSVNFSGQDGLVLDHGSGEVEFFADEFRATLEAHKAIVGYFRRFDFVEVENQMPSTPSRVNLDGPPLRLDLE